MMRKKCYSGILRVRLFAFTAALLMLFASSALAYSPYLIFEPTSVGLDTSDFRSRTIRGSEENETVNVCYVDLPSLNSESFELSVPFDEAYQAAALQLSEVYHLEKEDTGGMSLVYSISRPKGDPRIAYYQLSFYTADGKTCYTFLVSAYDGKIYRTVIDDLQPEYSY